MPVHDWTRVAAGIFHHFHHGWITEIAHLLNERILPRDYYALAEQFAAGFGPDVLVTPPLQPVAETELAFYRRKQKVIAVRHVSGDQVVAVLKIKLLDYLTLAAYETGTSVRAYVVHVAVGQALPEMPLFLEPRQAVMVPLEVTYQAAFADVPQRWRRVLEATAAGEA
jgi:hypothetical protein